MSLNAGTRLGHFEVRAPLGAGGMGEVYRARDLALDRDVALKVLPDAFAADPHRLARFAREARAAAALNHPNILTVFEVGTEATPYVAAELLTGQTLRILLGRPLPLSRALDYATQIAEGLAAAHAKGIVHRDIKPENLFVTTDGRVKILDFGIATRPDQEDASVDPTLTAPGAVIGSPAYMAPEQVRGEPVDARADIFALGAVLYEMLAGQRAFRGSTSADTTSAVLTTEPPAVAEVVPSVPASVARVVHRCLAKSRDQRFQAAKDIVFALEEAIDPVPERGPSIRRRRIVSAVLAIAALLAVAAGLRFGAGPSPSAAIRRLSMGFPETARLSTDVYVPFSLSPNGSLLAYVTTQPEWLVVRPLDGFETTTLPGTEGAYDPFFSPDGQWLGFWTNGQIKKVPVAGGPPAIVCQSRDMMGASWSKDGTIIFAPGLGEGLSMVPASGGAPQALTSLDAARNEIHHAFPQVIDDGRAVLFTVATRSKDHPYSVEVVDLATRTRRVVMRGAQYGRYVSSLGQLLFMRDDKLFAVKLARGTWNVVGQAQPVLDAVHSTPQGLALYSVANDGTLAYVPTRAPSESVPVWVDRSGSAREVGLPTGAYDVPRLSPDGKTMAVNIKAHASSDVWVASIEDKTLERLTFGRGLVWSFPALAISNDSRWLSFAEDTEAGTRLLSQSLDRSGPSREWLVSNRAIGPSQWLREGEGVLVGRNVGENGGDLFLARPSMNGILAPLVEQPGNQWGATLSADERFMAYASDETGRFEVFVTPFPGPGPRRQLTTEGGWEPVWSRDGREIFFRLGERMFSIPVATKPTLTIGRPRLLFEGRFVTGAAGIPQYDEAPDGRFLMLRPVGGPPPSELRVVVNWFDELRRRVP